MKIFLLCLMLVVSPLTTAEENTWLHAGLWSQHLDGRKGRNQDHGLIAVEHDNILVGTYINSYQDRTYLALKMNRQGFCMQRFCLGHSYGFFKGYRIGSYTGVVPMILPLLSYTGDNWGSDIQCILPEVCSIQFRFQL